MFKKLITLSLLFCTAQTFAQYNAYELFHPLWNYGPVSPARSAAGVPGPNYWQNVADYKISASLDDTNRQISGDVEITYKNYSPDKLPFLWLQLDQNSFNTQSRGGKTTPVLGGRFGNVAFDGAIKLKAFQWMESRPTLLSKTHGCRFAWLLL